MDNKVDLQRAPSSSSMSLKLISNQTTGEDFPFEKETGPCSTPASSSIYHNAANGINLKDSDEYIRNLGSILSLQPWIFKRESTKFNEEDASVSVNGSRAEIPRMNFNLGLVCGRNKSSLRARRDRRNTVKPLSMENCLIPQLYDENFEFEEYVFGSLTVTPRPFFVTDGKRVISKSGCETSLHREVDCSRVKKGIVGVSPLPEVRNGKRKSVDLEEARLDISDNILRSRLQSPSHGSSNCSRAFPFSIGVYIGVLSAIISNRNEVEKLNDKLRCSENLVQDLQEELEMKDALTVQELLPHENSSTNLLQDKRTAEDSQSMSKIEAELEAELARLELSITASNVEGNTSALDEFEEDLVGEVVEGELRADSLSRRDDDIIEVVRSNNASNSSSSSPVDTDTCNYPVSPRKLSLRLHEVIQERLELRIKELEEALAQSHVQLQLLENERSIPSERTLSNSDEMGSSSNQESPTVTGQPSPFCLNLSGDALDAYGELYEEFMRISGEDNNNNNKKEEFYEVDHSLILGLGRNNGYDGHDHDDDDDGDNDDDDDEGRLIIQKIVERTKQGSPAIRHAQMMLLSLDD